MPTVPEPTGFARYPKLTLGLFIILIFFAGLSYGLNVTKSHWYSPIVEHPTDWRTASFNFILTITTIYLYRLNNELLNANKRSADAAMASIEIQLPRLSYSKFTLDRYNGFLMATVEPTSGGGRQGMVHVEIVNTGQSSAKLQSFCVNHQVGLMLTGKPDYSGAYALAPNTYLDGVHTFKQPHIYTVTDIEQDNIIAGRQYLLLYGFVSYEDFQGRPHVYKFCQYWLGGIMQQFIQPPHVPNEFID